MLNKSLAILVAFSVAFFLAACQGVEPSGSSSGDPAPSDGESPYGGFSVPSPAPDEIIFTVEGANTVALSLDDLRALPAVSVTVREPFVQEHHTYTGVLLGDLFGLAAVSEDSRVDTIALNDYRYADSASELVAAGAILAYLEDGDAIAMDRGGPVRLVYAESSPYFIKLEAWNWSLRFVVEIPE
jgi:hypothetical protein